MGVARPVFPDWNRANRDILAPGLNPVFDGQQAPRIAAPAVAKQLNEFFTANPQ